ncbi:MAG: serpin family protein [Planctomycetota bacterium]|nr:serpin family protein [Planctomycetota bacterium]
MRPIAGIPAALAAIVMWVPTGRGADGETPAAETGKARAQVVEAVVAANGDFALRLYERAAKGRSRANLFFSPYSMSSVLAMAAEGARGETALEMGTVLGYPASLRRTGEQAKATPWDMETIHRGMAALHARFNPEEGSERKALREKLAMLRKQLDEANDRVMRPRVGDTEPQRKAQAIAAEINRLQVQVDQYELRTANALWGDKGYPFAPGYLGTIRRYYKTGQLSLVDFPGDFDGACRQINAWVDRQTNGRIKDIIDPGSVDQSSRDLMRLVLTNAVYFHGQWKEVFQESNTTQEDFYVPQGQAMIVPLMHQTQEAGYAAFRSDGSFFDTPDRIARGETDQKKLYPGAGGFQMLELPYKGDALSMVLLLPQARESLAGLEKKLTARNLAEWIKKLRGREVEVFVPKFRLSADLDMGKLLQEMGMVRVFRQPQWPQGAQLDGMTNSDDPLHKLYIYRVAHRAFVDVNEKGTEAAAATVMFSGGGACAAPDDTVPFTPVFRADSPFVFLIRDRQTGLILFIGRLVNPR